MTNDTETAHSTLPGSVTIADDAVEHLVGHTALECYGIVGMASKSLVDGVARMLGRESLTQGIEVARQGDRLRIDLYVVMEHGLNLSEVAAAVRERIVYQVERLSGLTVGDVQIHIQGVRRR